MYSLSTAFLNAAQSGARKILIKAIFNDEVELTGENIINMSVTEAVSASDGISMGTTISSKLDMTIKAPENALLLDDGFVDASIGFDGVFLPANFEFGDDGTLKSTADVSDDGVLTYTIPLGITPNGVLTLGAFDIPEYCPLGRFYTSRAESGNNFKTTFKIEAYDAFLKTEETYSPAISMPNTAEAILADIAKQCGFSLSPDIEYPAGEFALYDFTCRQYIGYFAGLLGKNARFDRNGDLTFVWYTNHGYIIDSEHQYLGGLKRLTDMPFNVQSISSGTSEVTVVAGTGIGISFENPFMDQGAIDRIWSNVGSFSFVPLQVKWRGNPAVEVGDILLVEDKDGTRHTTYVMEQVLKISGGMHSEIKCYGQSESSISFSTSPSQKKLQQVYTKLQQAIQDATTLINSKNGGVFKLIDENGDGINDGWIIQSDDGLIKATSKGIGISSTGEPPFTEALTALGLNASAITTGQLNAQRVLVGDKVLGDVFSVDQDEDGHIVVTIGASESDIKQKQTNEAIVFVDKSENQVAKFSITGAEWQSMQQMKYCGFIWTKSANTGNVRFTKVVE